MTRNEWLQNKKRDAITRYNEIFAPIYDGNWGRNLDPTHVQHVNKIVTGLPQGATVIDAACGSGKYWSLFDCSSTKLVAVDQSQAMLDLLTAKYPHAECYLQSLQSLEVPCQANVVMCIDAMENIPPEDWPVVLRNLKKHLNQGGILYLTVEAEEKETIDAAFLKAREMGLPVVHGEVAIEGYHYYPEREQVMCWLQKAGLTVVTQKSGDGYWHYLCKH